MMITSGVDDYAEMPSATVIHAYILTYIHTYIGHFFSLRAIEVDVVGTYNKDGFYD